MFLALYVTVAVCSTNLVATIRIANNNPNRPSGPLVYSTLQAAITSAVAGDTIYVIPSLTSYGNASVNKRLVIFGIGHTPAKDIGIVCTLGTITLSSVAASGTKLSGLVATVEVKTGQVSDVISDLIIEKSVIRNITLSSGVSNILVTNCYLNGFQGSSVAITGCIIVRNVIQGDPYSDIITMPSGGSDIFIINNIIVVNNNGISAYNRTIISNNVFYSPYTSYSAFLRATDCVVSNNIFYKIKPGAAGSPFERNAFNNNISFGAADNTLPPAGTGVGNTGSGNLVGINPEFVNPPASTSSALLLTYDYHLQPTSPGKNAGTDGTDIGIYGGGSPWVFSPTGSTLPVVQSLNVSSIIKVGDSLKVQIKAKGY
jgi:hypothetical protein